MTNGREFDQPAIYRIRVKGKLDPKWSHWFDEFSITLQGGNESLLTGYVSDQGALYGLIAKMGGFGLLLLSVERAESEKSSDQ